MVQTDASKPYIVLQRLNLNMEIQCRVRFLSANREGLTIHSYSDSIDAAYLTTRSHPRRYSRSGRLDSPRASCFKSRISSFRTAISRPRSGSSFPLSCKPS